MFRNHELAWTHPYKGSDTVFYLGSNGTREAIVIDSVSPTQLNCTNCCATLMAPRPINFKGVFVRHFYCPNDAEAMQEIDPGAPLKWSKTQRLLGITRYPDQNEFEIQLSFRSFHVGPDSALKPFIQEKTAFGLGKVEGFYLLESRYPERVVDSADVQQVLWSKEQGLLGYRNKSGLAFIREDLATVKKELKKPKVLIVPCANGYNYAAHMGTVNSFIEAAMELETDVEYLPFPYKVMQGSGYHGVYKAADCRTILERTDADILVMTWMLGDIHTHLSQPEGTWGYRTKVLNRHTMEETKSIHAKNLDEFEDLEDHVNKNVSVLTADILNSLKDE